MCHFVRGGTAWCNMENWLFVNTSSCAENRVLNMHTEHCGVNRDADTSDVHTHL
jgi:hypothetical protein